jgi:transposase
VRCRCSSCRAVVSPSCSWPGPTAYAGEGPATATPVIIEIVRKAPDQVGFVVHARRWVIERLFGWLGRNRRLARDVEATLASATAFVYAASVMLLVRRLGRC